MSAQNFEKIDEFRFRIARSGAMQTDGLIYTDEKMLEDLRQDQCLQQVINVACLPGIVGNSMAMPDIHWGYGFPIGGVAAFDMEKGVVSPGGVGYDINCGVRLMTTSLDRADIKSSLDKLVNALYQNIPSGVGSHRKDLKLSRKEFDGVLRKGARWVIESGQGESSDKDFIEENGSIPGADPDIVSKKAYERGKDQLGTLGSGNHFVEVGVVQEVFDERAANVMGLFKNQVTVFIHTGSRGLGHQVCDDYLVKMLDASRKYGIMLPDRQLCCAPITSKEGQEYLAAMAAAANFGFANRQLITHWVRETFQHVFHRSPRDLAMKLLYDVAHNVAKIESHRVGSVIKKLCVHRKGATRAFPPHHREIPALYAEIGQPVLVPGDMGRCSYVLLGTEKAMEESFGSSCHGAGRVLSRSQAKKVARGRSIVDELREKGISVKAASMETLVEEMPDAYKDVSQVVEIMAGSGLCRKVVKLRPLAVIKG
ncbi:MAG: RtcB family protein [Candidatus Eremiobacteraeota bacterium]|nr:RtcB family protein [Candidatus Eremiobacteraeota bacterium]